MLSEVRRDPIVYSRITIISPIRGLRPREVTFVRHEALNISKCPFCRGSEEMTPPATLVVKYEEGCLKFLRDSLDSRVGDWLVRIIPNKYPIFTRESLKVYGYHEVVIEHPEHNVNIYNIPAEHLRLVFLAVFHRIRELYNDPRIRHAYLFKNFGGGGGASLPHPHMQLVATSTILPSIYEELRYSKALYNRLSNCPYCELLKREVGSPRLIYMNKGFAVIASYAPRNSYETWILPLKHMSDPLKLGDDGVSDLADAFSKLMSAYSKCLGNIDLNFWLHMSPNRSKYESYYHWHLEVLPITTPWGGLEKGGNAYVVTLSPEDSANELRRSLNTS